MIWYLLYPFRGTTNPPSLPASHPIRRAFQSHGTAAARHWLLSLFLTVIVSVLLLYPAIFQTDSEVAARLRNLPKHEWTSTTQTNGDRLADIEVRQVWVHGDYMHAIDRRVLREALSVQAALIGNGFDEVSNGDSKETSLVTQDKAGFPAPRITFEWGYHSPLMYWNCSLETLDKDLDLLATINARSDVRSSLNLTLRPSTVFAGKSFVNTKLHSADALVITLFDQTARGLGAIWDSRSQRLASTLSSEWTLFPGDGKITQSRLYEFRFRPMSLRYDLFLAASYAVFAIYSVGRLKELRAFKSWFGLLLTVGVKMTICVISSFTICTYLDIDLGKIPRPWFPGTVLIFAFGNISRLINAILLTPPEMLPHQRIGHALGEVGYLSVIIAGQNLVLIWLTSCFLSMLVEPSITEFCTFIAVVCVLDLVYHLTFFLAVLSVDIQRMELSDSLDRVSSNPPYGRQSWLSAIRYGRVPLSTRFAGTVTILFFIWAASWHLLEVDISQFSLRNFRRVFSERDRKSSRKIEWSPSPINQARTPADWLRIQDHHTAQELLGFIKPYNHSFVAKIYDPLLVVLQGAEGRSTSLQAITLSTSFRQFAQNHAYPAALMVAFLIAGVTLLMNYLLWSGLPDSLDDEEAESMKLHVSTLTTEHTLDIAKLISSSKGHLISVSLDRSIYAWRTGVNGISGYALQSTATMSRLWPFLVLTMDDNGEILVFCTENGQLSLFDLSASCFAGPHAINLRGQEPLLFTSFVIPDTAGNLINILIILPSGELIQIDAHTGVVRSERICSDSLSTAALYIPPKSGPSLVFVTETRRIYILKLSNSDDCVSKSSELVTVPDICHTPASIPHKFKDIVCLPVLGIILAVHYGEALVIDFASRTLICRLPMSSVQRSSLRVMHSVRQQCTCGAAAIQCLSIAYNEESTDNMIMQTFSASNLSSSLICLGRSLKSTPQCQKLTSAEGVVHSIESAGVWESTNGLDIIGVRRRNIALAAASTESHSDHTSTKPTRSASSLKELTMQKSQTKGFPSLFNSGSCSRKQTSASDHIGIWEAWTLSAFGIFRSQPLYPDPDTNEASGPNDNDLYVTVAGPIAKWGNRGMAIGFGNSIKIVTLGKDGTDGLTSAAGLGFGFGLHRARHKKTLWKKTQ